MPTKQQAAEKRLRAAVANHIKVHKQAMKKAKGSVPAGRLRKKRRKKAAGGKRMTMGWDTSRKWKSAPISDQRKAQTLYQNKKNKAANKWAKYKADQRAAADSLVWG